MIIDSETILPSVTKNKRNGLDFAKFLHNLGKSATKIFTKHLPKATIGVVESKILSKIPQGKILQGTSDSKSQIKPLGDLLQKNCARIHPKKKEVENATSINPRDELFR